MEAKMSAERQQIQRSQYHHYIPRFVLRNFEEKDSIRTQEAREFYGTIKNRDGLIRYYDLEERDLGFRLISNAYGVTDMYRDAKLPDTMYIEKALSKLEGQAANVIRKLLNAQRDRRSSVSLSGRELHILRRFLYVMQYRTRIIRERYQCSIEEYEGVDKEELKEHMRRHNFQTPNDVWLETLRLILDAPETANSEGYDALKGKMYDGDYKELKHNLDNFFVCLCEPESDADEFIMTDTGFAVTEGRDIVEELRSMGLQDFAQQISAKRFPFTEYNKIAVISPRLAIVLRSSIFRDQEVNRILKQKIFAIMGPSQFDDLPVKPATATYVNPLEPRKEILQSTVQLPDGSFKTFGSVEGYTYTMEDTYEFGIYPIPTKDILYLSTMQIAKVQDAITFSSDKAMLASLDHAIKTTKKIPLSVLARQEKAGSITARRLASKLQLSALLDNLTDGKNRENVPSELFSFSRMAETITEQLKGTSYITLAHGSIDMFSWDLQEAQKAENERNKILSTFRHLPKKEIEKKLRENSERLLKELNTRVLFLTTRLNHALEIPDIKKWLLPTPAEICVMKLWNNPKVSELEFKRLFVTAIWKENYRGMASAGIRQQLQGQKWQMHTQMLRMEHYVSEEWGSAIAWAKQTNRYDALLSARLLLTQMRICPLASETTDEAALEMDFRGFLRRFLFCSDHPVLAAPLRTAFPDLFEEEVREVWREVLLVWLFPVVDTEWVEARWEGRKQGGEDLKGFGRKQGGEDLKVFGRSLKG